MYKTVFSKKIWLTVLALGLAGFATLAIWAQVAQAQSSVVSVSVSQEYGEDSGGSDVTVTLRASGSNDFVPAGNGTGEHGMYNVKTVDARADCNEDDFDDAADFGVADNRFEVKRSRDSSYTRSSVSQTFTTGNAVPDDDILVRAGSNTDHDGMYICVEATYSDGDDDIVEYAVSSTMLDLASPMVDDVVVNDDDRNQEYGLGENIDIEVEFDERVYVRKVTDSSNSDAVLPYIDNALGADKDAELRSTASGATLTFRYTVEFLDSNGDITDLDDFMIATPDGGDDDSDSDYVITDAAGNMLAVDGAIDEEIDFRGGELLIELTVKAMRIGDRLVVKATPDMYEDADGEDVDTVASAIAYSSEDAPDVRGNEDPCKDGIVEDGSRYDEAADADDYLGVDLPDEPDGEYYCFVVTDAATPGRVVYTNVYRYADDNTAPHIGVTYDTDGNAVINVTDTGSGPDMDSVTWKVLDSSSQSCIPESTGNNTSTKIRVTAAHDGVRICITASDNAGNKRSATHTLRYNSPPTIPDPPEPPEPPDPDPDPDPDPPEPVDGVETCVLPLNWPTVVSEGRAGAINPCGCSDATKIRADNGTCTDGSGLPAQGSDVVESGPVTPGPVEPGPVEPGPVEPGPVEPGTGPVTPDPVDEPTVEPEPEKASVTANYDDETGEFAIIATAAGNVEYAFDETGECGEDLEYQAVPGSNVVTPTEDQKEKKSYICVRAEAEDGGELVDGKKQVGDTSVPDPDTPPTDEEEGISSWVIIAGVVAVILVGGIIIFFVASKGRES